MIATLLPRFGGCDKALSVPTNSARLRPGWPRYPSSSGGLSPPPPPPLARRDNDDNDGLQRPRDSCRVHIAKRRLGQNFYRFTARRTHNADVQIG